MIQALPDEPDWPQSAGRAQWWLTLTFNPLPE